MNRNARSRMALGAVGLLLAALAGAGGAVAAAGVRDAGSSQVDDADAADGVRAGVTQVLSRRIVINGVAAPGVKLLAIPGLGVLNAVCATGSDAAYVKWINTTGAAVDVWANYDDDGKTRPVIASAGADLYAAYWEPGNVYQIGTQLDLGQGNSPGARRTATIRIDVYRSGTGAPCGMQATATTWHNP